MNSLQFLLRFFQWLIIGVLFFNSFTLQAQTTDLSLVQVEIPDTVVLGDTIVVSAYLKNNAETIYSTNNLTLSYYVNEIQDTDKSAVIQNQMIESTINLSMGDSVLIEQEVVVDDLLFQIGAEQDIQKNIVIVWPTEDNYSINYHLQPLVVLKQAIPTAIFNASPIFTSTEILEVMELPSSVQNLILSEYSAFEITEMEQQDFDGGSLQYQIELENGEEEIKLYFSGEGILVLVETSIDESILLTAITDFINANYPNPPHFIDSAYELVFNDGTIQYKVEIKNAEDSNFEKYEYFDTEGVNIANLGIIVEFYEEPEIEIGGINLPESIELGTAISVDGTLTNNLPNAYNDVAIPINYASLPFPPTTTTPKLRTEVSSIDEIQPNETLSFQQNFQVEEDLFYVGKNIVIAWPTDYIMGLRTNCLAQEVYITITREDTVGIETIPALSNEIVLAPNPTLQYLNIETNQLEIESVTIFDMAARPVEQHYGIHQMRFQMDVSYLNQGMYLLYVQTHEGNAVKKLIIGN